MINSLSIPTYQQGRDLDFSSLAQLPQVWRQAQQDATRREMLGAFGKGAASRDVAMKLAQSGDLQGALTLANLDWASELTPAMKEYSFARRQGFPGSFVDFWHAWRNAGGRNG